MRRLALFVLAILAGSLQAQTCNDLIAEGRSFLTASNILQANARFASAVALCPGNEVARFYHAATALAALPYRPAVSNFLDRVGLPPEGRDIYNWTAMLPRHTNGTLIIPAGFNAEEAVVFLRTNILLAISAAAADLAQITSPGFLVTLSYEETKMADLTVDYGDVLVLRAELHALEFWAYSLYGWNLDVHLAALEQLDLADQLSVQRVLHDFPQLLTFATTNDLAAAKAAFQNAVARYLEGSAFIRARPANLVRLFMYDLELADREEKFRCTLINLRDSLQTPNVLCLDTNYVVYLANYFSGQSPPRAGLPRFARNAVEIGSLPDLSFGGILGGLTEATAEDFLSRGVDVLSVLRNPEVQASGRFTCEFPTLANRIYALEFSGDLINWTPLLQFYSEGGVYAFIDGGARNTPYRFYRLAELDRFLTITGTVRNRCSLAPIPGARVQLTSSMQTAMSDAAGKFSFRVPEAWAELWASANGYSSGRGWFDGKHTTLSIDLTPQGSPRPAHDDFANRIRISGFPATVQSSNCGADFYDFSENPSSYYTVWFSWSALIDGAVVIKAVGTLSVPEISVWTGTVPDSLLMEAYGYEEVRLEVVAGTTYQIAVATSDFGDYQPGQFTLTISAPPQLYWSAPVDGAEFSAPAHIVFDIGATDLSGDLREARYYANGKLIGKVTSPPFNFTWENVPPNEYWFEVRLEDAEGFRTSEYRQVFVRPANDRFANRIPLAGSNLRVVGSNRAATSEPGEPPHAGGGANYSVWWTWRAPASGPVSILAYGDDGDGQNSGLLAVYTGASLSQLIPVAEGGFVGHGVASQVSFQAIAQTQYQIAVDGYWGGDLQLRIVPTAAPQVNIVTPADGGIFVAPTNVTVQVQATDADNNLSAIELYSFGRLIHTSGSNPLVYQWTNLLEGYYDLYARAVDSYGVMGLSQSIVFEVRSAPPP